MFVPISMVKNHRIPSPQENILGKKTDFGGNVFCSLRVDLSDESFSFFFIWRFYWKHVTLTNQTTTVQRRIRDSCEIHVHIVLCTIACTSQRLRFHDLSRKHTEYWLSEAIDTVKKTGDRRGVSACLLLLLRPPPLGRQNSSHSQCHTVRLHHG